MAPKRRRISSSKTAIFTKALGEAEEAAEHNLLVAEVTNMVRSAEVVTLRAVKRMLLGVPDDCEGPTLPRGVKCLGGPASSAVPQVAKLSTRGVTVKSSELGRGFVMKDNWSWELASLEHQASGDVMKLCTRFGALTDEYKRQWLGKPVDNLHQVPVAGSGGGSPAENVGSASTCEVLGTAGAHEAFDEEQLPEGGGTESEEEPPP